MQEKNWRWPLLNRDPFTRKFLERFGEEFLWRPTNRQGSDAISPGRRRDVTQRCGISLLGPRTWDSFVAKQARHPTA